MQEPFIPYGRQTISDEDIEAVVEVLRSDWLTTGPMVERFEHAIADHVGMKHGVAVSSGTAALHSAMHAINIGPGDEVIMPPMTFAATANAVVYQGGTPVFADVDPKTLLLDPDEVEKKITPNTCAILAVDYAGQPCDYEKLSEIANRHDLWLVADGCHSLGASLNGRPCGGLADLTTFSFHPVKPVATGEGGMVVTNDGDLAKSMRSFRNHGITSDHRQRQKVGAWFYEMEDLGYNYRLTDIQCALGLSQLRRLPDWIGRRQEIAASYNSAFAGTLIQPLKALPAISHGYHLYVVRVPERDFVFQRMRERQVGVNIHYIPVYLHPYYQKALGPNIQTCPIAEAAYAEILSLPIYPGMTDELVERVAVELRQALELAR